MASNLVVEVLAGAVIGGTSILYAAVGESYTESAGVVNLGTEGGMLVGALAGYAIAAETGNPWMGAAAGALAGGSLALVHAWLVLARKANQLANGLVMLFLALGLTSLFGAAYVSKESAPFTRWAVPVLSDIPGLGTILFDHDPLTYLSYLLVPVSFWVLYRSGLGLMIRGTGERKEVLATVFEPVYLAGVVAGKTTKTNKLGYVYAFPITQTIENINAFQLGAKSVNPAAQTYVVNTSQWCDPAKQADAAKSLFDQGVDVITQHQDCTATITKAAEAAGKFVVGYHADASTLAPKGWLAGSEWAWNDLFTDIVKTAMAGSFTGSKYNANYRIGYHDGANPFVQSKYGPAVSDETKKLVDEAKAKISAPTGSPFAGPVVAQDGSVIIPAGQVPNYADIETKMTAFVQGVVGQIPKA